MKYSPDFNPLKNFEYKNKEQLEMHLSFVRLIPGNKKPYWCRVCEKTFLTSLGASNHVDFAHTKLVLATLKKDE